GAPSRARGGRRDSGEPLPSDRGEGGARRGIRPGGHPGPPRGVGVSALDPSRTVRELKELRARTDDERGAQRLAWTDGWTQAREWFAGLLDGLPVTREVDEAGNVWVTLPGTSSAALLIGGHLDSVP